MTSIRQGVMNDAFMERTEVLSAAIKEYGFIEQEIVAIEELAELQKALAKWIRAMGDKKETLAQKEYMRLIANVREEIADVQIMIDQMRLIFGGTEEEELMKLMRLKARLQKRTDEI